jgi:nitrous oxidase accessory protein
MTFRLLFIFTVFILITSGDLEAKQLVLCPSCEYNSLKEAIASAGRHDTLILDGGHYKEGNIIVDKPLSIIGKNKAIVDGLGETEIFTIESDSVTIMNLQIQNVGTSYVKDRAAIKVETQKYVRIENNHLVNAFFGIYLVRSRFCIIRNNLVEGNAINEASSGNAIQLWYSKDILIEKNLCTHHRDGIYIEFSDRCKISNNISKHNLRYGLHFMFSDSNLYYRNVFEHNKGGVAVMYSSYIQMEQNTFKDNWGASSYGLLLKEIKDSELKENIFKGNTVGIYSEGTVRLDVHHNLLESNGWAVVIRGSCEENFFWKNNFLSNTFEISTDSRNHTGNGFEGNYWSHYNGYDLNKDGIGDVPHNPISLFSYIVENNPTSIILLRSLFIDLLNLAEKITPVLTPVTLIDQQPTIDLIP